MKQFGTYEVAYEVIQDHGIYKHLRIKLVVENNKNNEVIVYINETEVGKIIMITHKNGMIEYQSETFPNIRHYDLGWVSAKMIENCIVKN